MRSVKNWDFLNSCDWERTARIIRDMRRNAFVHVGDYPLSTELCNLFNNMKRRMDGMLFKDDSEGFAWPVLKKDAKFEDYPHGAELEAMRDVLLEIFQELNTLKPIGANYKTDIDEETINKFIVVIKKVYGQGSYMMRSMVDWLEDYKKTYLGNKIINPTKRNTERS